MDDKLLKYLAPVVKKFFKAAESDLTTDESFHGLRIRTKKLRYTMEIVAVAFDSAFRKKLYPQVTLFQDLLGNRQRSRHGEDAVSGLAVEIRGCGAEGFLGGAAAGGRTGDRGSSSGIPGHMDAEGRVRPETAVPGLLADPHVVFPVISHISDGNLILASFLSASLNAGDMSF